MTPSRDRSRYAGAVLAGLLALGLQIAAIHAHSLSGDGAYHLLAGHQALRYGQNTVNLEHPPLVKLVVALPLLLERAPPEPVRVDEALARANSVYGQGEMIRRATVRGRYLALAVFVLPFLFAVYLTGRRFADPRTGVVLVMTTALSIGVLPYLTILQTDVAVSLAFLLTLLAAAALMEGPSYRRAALVGLASGFALAVKFSGLLLGPTVLVSVLLAKATWRRRMGQLALIGAIAVLVLEATYAVANLDYDSELGRETIRVYCANRGTLAVDDRMEPWQDELLAVERVDPRAAQWLTGLLGVRIQNAIGVYPSFAFGEVRSEGRWWYFPAVLLIKTPLAVLIAAAVALGLSVGQAATRGVRPAARQIPGESAGGACPGESAGGACPAKTPGNRRLWILPLVTVVVYLATSITSNYNLSVRHMLPIVPLLYLPIARFVARRRLAAEILVGVLAVESLLVAPLWMSSTNTWWLGEKNPTRFVLGAGNLEYRQSFVQLARYAEAHDLRPLFVLYPALPDTVIRPYLPEARMKRPGQEIEPGWYAVSVTVEQFVPALLKARPEDVHNFGELRRGAELWQPFWQAVTAAGEDHGWVAGTFHLYEVPGFAAHSAAPAFGEEGLLRRPRRR